MSVAFVDGQIVTEFVNSDAFEKWVDERFDALDANQDGVISREEFEKRSGKFSSPEFELQSNEEIRNLYNILFEKFDTDQNGTINREEFKVLMKEIMQAKARGFGNAPISCIVQGDSLLQRAVEYQSAKND